MIGQEKLLDDIQVLIDRKTYPRFSIFIGPKGSGKKTLAKEVSYRLGTYTVQLPDVKVDTIRSMISNAYKIPYTYLYIIPDIENMSLAAKNALLKVTEEPPNDAYFIMTAQDSNTLLSTIKSRGTIFHMNSYTPTEIGKYAMCDNMDDAEIITSICETPGDVDIIKAYDPAKFYAYVESVVDNIAETSGSNSFKIGNKINFKDDPEKYDLSLFWRTFMLICLKRVSDDPLKFTTGVRITSEHLKQLSITGINRSSLFDTWILSIREAWI